MIDIPKHKAEERENLQKKIEEYFKAGKDKQKKEKAKQGEITGLNKPYTIINKNGRRYKKEL